jgi:hypothetical protein
MPILLSHAPSGFYVEGDNTTLPCLSSEFCQPTRKQAAKRHVYSVAFLWTVTANHFFLWIFKKNLNNLKTVTRLDILANDF